MSAHINVHVHCRCGIVVPVLADRNQVGVGSDERHLRRQFNCKITFNDHISLKTFVYKHRHVSLVDVMRNKHLALAHLLIDAQYDQVVGVRRQREAWKIAKTKPVSEDSGSVWSHVTLQLAVRNRLLRLSFLRQEMRIGFRHNHSARSRFVAPPVVLDHVTHVLQ